jgi:hypothetical protein
MNPPEISENELDRQERERQELEMLLFPTEDEQQTVEGEVEIKTRIEYSKPEFTVCTE